MESGAPIKKKDRTRENIDDWWWDETPSESEEIEDNVTESEIIRDNNAKPNPAQSSKVSKQMQKTPTGKVKTVKPQHHRPGAKKKQQAKIKAKAMPTRSSGPSKASAKNKSKAAPKPDSKPVNKAAKLVPTPPKYPPPRPAPKKGRKGGGWGEVGLYVACYGFMFVVNLCSLLLMFFVAVVWVLQGSEVFSASG